MIRHLSDQPLSPLFADLRLAFSKSMCCAFHAVVPDHHTGLFKMPRIQLSLRAQRIQLAGLDDGRRQRGQFLFRCCQRRAEDFPQLRQIRITKGQAHHGLLRQRTFPQIPLPGTPADDAAQIRPWMIRNLRCELKLSFFLCQKAQRRRQVRSG